MPRARTEYAKVADRHDCIPLSRNVLPQADQRRPYIRVRLAWPLVMCLSLLAMVHVVAAHPRGKAVVMLGIAFALQFYSAWPYWAYEYRDARAAVEPLAPPPQILDGGSRLLVIEELEGVPTNARPLRFAMHLAVESGIRLEGGWFSRPPPKGEYHEGRELPSDEDARYVATATEQTRLPTRLPQVAAAVICVRWEWLFVCRPE